MKKLTLGLGAAALILIGLFVWLASSASPDNAPKELKTIELDAP